MSERPQREQQLARQLMEKVGATPTISEDWVRFPAYYVENSPGSSMMKTDHPLWQFSLSLLERLEQTEQGLTAATHFFNSPKSFSNEEFRGVAEQVYEAKDGKPCTYTGKVPYLDEYAEAKSRLEQAEGIVRELANNEPYYLHSNSTRHRCALCEVSLEVTGNHLAHKDACPYRRAQQYLEGK